MQFEKGKYFLTEIMLYTSYYNYTYLLYTCTHVQDKVKATLLKFCFGNQSVRPCVFNRIPITVYAVYL